MRKRIAGTFRTDDYASIWFSSHPTTGLIVKRGSIKREPPTGGKAGRMPWVFVYKPKCGRSIFNCNPGFFKAHFHKER